MKQYFKNIVLLTVFLASSVAYGQFKIIGYVPNWVNLNNFSDNFDYSRVTHLCIAFKDPDAGGIVPTLSSGEQYLVNAAHTNGVKVFLSLCGGSASTNSSKRAIYFNLINSTNRELFAKKLKDYTLANNLDGIDLDLEGPAINSDYGDFVQVLADSLHKYDLLLSAALSQGYGGDNVPSSTFDYFDWINIMAYDACGPTWGTPGQHSSYLFATQNLNYWKGRGLAKSKAILGVPFYGYGFDAAFSYGTYTYKNIAAGYPDNIMDDQAGSTIYYNGISTIIDKTSLAKSSGGGIMIWELSNDATGNASLLKQIRAVAGSAVTAVTPENNVFEMLVVSPNPSTGIVKFSGMELSSTTIEVYNALGEKIASLIGVDQIDLSNEMKGIYSVHFQKGNKITYRKVVVQ